MQKVQAIFPIFRFVYFAWFPVLYSAMPTIFWCSIDLVNKLYFVRFLFFSYMCKLNLFTIHIMYQFFIVQIGEREKFLNTNDAESFVFFLILEKFICLLVYFITFTMNPCVTSITLNTLMIFSNRSISNFTGKLYYDVLKW